MEEAEKRQAVEQLNTEQAAVEQQAETPATETPTQTEATEGIAVGGGGAEGNAETTVGGEPQQTDLSGQSDQVAQPKKTKKKSALEKFEDEYLQHHKARTYTHPEFGNIRVLAVDDVILQGEGLDEPLISIRDVCKALGIDEKGATKKIGEHLMAGVLEKEKDGKIKSHNNLFATPSGILDLVFHSELPEQTKRDFIRWLNRKVVPDAFRTEGGGEPKPVGKGPFGNIYDQFKGKAKEAVDFLTKKRSGEAVGALHHKDVGDIDLVWGEEGTGHSDGYGLAKIAKYHPEVLDGMHVVSSSDNCIVLESDTHKAVVSRKLGDKETPDWLLTAYEKKEGKGKGNSGGSSDIVPEPGKGKQNGTAPLQEPSSGDKGTTNTGNAQGGGAENAQVKTGQELKERANSKVSGKKLSESQAKKIDIKDFTDKKGLYGTLFAVYYKDGYMHATDGKVAIKMRADYPEEYEGKMIDPRNGREVEGRYVNIDGAMDLIIGGENVTKVRNEDVAAAVETAKELLKGRKKKGYPVVRVAVALPGRLVRNAHDHMYVAADRLASVVEVMKNSENSELYTTDRGVVYMADGVKGAIMPLVSEYMGETNGGVVVQDGKVYADRWTLEKVDTLIAGLRNEMKWLTDDRKRANVQKEIDKWENFRKNARGLGELVEQNTKAAREEDEKSAAKAAEWAEKNTGKTFTDKRNGDTFTIRKVEDGKVEWVAETTLPNGKRRSFGIEEDAGMVAARIRGGEFGAEAKESLMEHFGGDGEGWLDEQRKKKNDAALEESAQKRQAAKEKAAETREENKRKALQEKIRKMEEQARKAREAAAEKEAKGEDDGAGNEAPTQTQEATTQTTNAQGGAEKIDDWGEELEGARKFALRDLAKKMDKVNVQNLVAMPLSKVFPRQDFAKQVQQGKLSAEDATFLEALQALVYGKRKPQVHARGGAQNVAEWANDVNGILSVIKAYCDAETPEARQAVREVALSNADIIKKEDAYRDSLRDYNRGITIGSKTSDESIKKIGNIHSEKPVKVVMDILRRLGYPEESAGKAVFPEITSNYNGSAYRVSLDGRKTYECATYEEALDYAVKLAKMARGDNDVTYDKSDFRIRGEGEHQWRNTGRYVARAILRNGSQGREVFSTKEEAEKYVNDFIAEAKEKKRKVMYTDITEERASYYPAYTIMLNDPLGRADALKIEGIPTFETEKEAQDWMDQNMGELNERANETAGKADDNKEKRERKVPLELFYEDRSHKTMGVYYRTPIGALVKLKGGFKSGYAGWKEANDWMEGTRARMAQAQAEKEAAQRELQRQNSFRGAETRKGTDWRKGKNITPEEFGNKFGFRGVQFGNWANQEERQRAMNEAYDSFMDLAELLGVSPDALSLNGELGIAFGSRGSGSAGAHYEPLKVVINLTKTRGAGSLAHEWWHALDNYFSRRGGVSLGMLTEPSRGRLNANVRPEVVEAYDNLVKAIEGSDYDKRSRARGTYWGKKEEETARLFAEWVDKKLQEGRKKNSFLSSGVDEALLDKYVKLNYDFYKYITGNESMTLDEFKKRPEAYEGWTEPLADEVDKFDPMIKALFDTIQEKKEGGKAVLFSVEERKAKKAEREKVEKLSAGLEDALTKLNVPRVVCRSAEEMVSAYHELTGREMSLEQAKRSNAFVDKVDDEDVVFFNAEKLAGGRTAEAAAAKGREITAHEVLGHYGLPVLMGEEGHKKFCGQVYGSMSEAARERFNAYYFDNNLNRGRHGDILRRLGLDEDTFWEELTAEQKSRVLGELGDRMTRGAADEYIAHLAERVERGEVLPKEEKTLWDSIVDVVRRLLGFDAEDETFGDRDIAKAIMDSKRNLEQRARLEEIGDALEEARESGDRKAERRLTKERDAIERNMEARRASIDKEMRLRDEREAARRNHDVFGEARAVADMEAERRRRRGDVRRSKEETERVLSGVKGQKQAGARYDAGTDGINAGMDGMDGDLRNSVGRKRKEVMERRLEKSRPDITEDERRALFDYLDTLDDTKMENAAFDWFVKGTVRLPEDMDKVRQAVEVAGKAKVDPARYGSPMELLDAHADFKANGKRTNPDDVATLTNRKDYGNGVVVYDVADSEESRQNMRGIINTHWGEDCNPWCLLQGDGKGNLTGNSARYWKHYSKYPKRVAFKDGKLLAFFASDGAPTWWDRQDRPHGGLSVERLMDDGSGRTATYALNEETGEWGSPTDIHKGNRQDGTYESWYYNGQLKERCTYKNGKLDGLYEEWHDNGQQRERSHYKDGRKDGLYEGWYDNGQPKVRCTYKDDELDGLYEDWHDNGQPWERSHYKNGKLDGLYELWYYDGKPSVCCTYKNGKKDGLYELWFRNGQPKERCTYKDDELDGLYEDWHDNGQPKVRCTYKNGERDGLYELWYDDGKPRVRSEYRNGVKVRDLSAEEAERLWEEQQAELREGTGGKVSSEGGNSGDLRFSKDENLQKMSERQLDKDYFAAMERGDEDRMREIIDEVARRRGYDADESWRQYHTAPNRGGAEWEEGDGTLYSWTLADEVNDNPHRANRIKDSYYSSVDIHGSKWESISAIEDAMSAIRNGEDPMVTIYRAVPKDIKEDKMRVGDWVTMSREYAKNHGQHVLGYNRYRIIEEKVPASQLYWDGNDINEWGFDDGKEYRYKNTKNNRKLNDLVTRDDEGNVIPPSKRFNDRNEDVRFSRDDEPSFRSKEKEDEAIGKANERFNEELDAFAKGQSTGPLHLGVPSEALKASGLNGTEMFVSQRTLNRHLRKHDLTVDDIKNLPKALQNPLMVYEWGDKAKSLIAITEIRHGDDRITVAVKLERGGKGVEVNEIASVHAKEASRFFEDMAKTSGEEEIRGKFRWVGDKEKALEWLGMFPPKGTPSLTPEELSVAKVIENFENPKLPWEKVSENGEKSSEGGNSGDLRFSTEDETRRRAGEMAVDALRKKGVDVVTDAEEMLRVLDEVRKERKGGQQMLFAGEKGIGNVDRAEATTRLDDLGVAREMEQSGKDAKAIKIATGWERGADDKWRYEIPDFGVDLEALKDNGENDYLTKERPLRSVLTGAEELFEMYPELEEVRFRVAHSDAMHDARGNYSKKKKLVTVDGNYTAESEADELQNILTHEVQHAIQDIEGFSDLGSAWNVMHRADFEGKRTRAGREIDLWKKQEELEKRHEEAVNKYRNSKGWERDKWNKEAMSLSRALRDNIEEINRLEKEIEEKGYEEGHFVYKELATEIEARNAARRRDMLGTERRRTLASETEDVARKDQVILRNGIYYDTDGREIGKGVQHLKTKDGEILGFVHEGKVYIDPASLDANTPVHEYTHLWDTALEKGNKKLWQEGVELMKQTPLWEEVKNDPHYKDIAGDASLLASEVHSRLTGEEGRKYFEKLAKEAEAAKGPLEKAQVLGLMEQLRHWVEKAMKWLKDSVFGKQGLTLEEFRDMPLRDLLDGEEKPSERGRGEEGDTRFGVREGEEKETKPKYGLSEEKDENGHHLVLSSDGSTTFGKIGEETGLPSAPIKLSEGVVKDPVSGAGYGLLHIEARHGDQIRKAGYKDVPSFVEDVAKNWTKIRKGNKRGDTQTYLLELKDKRNNTLMVELSRDGEYWNVNTAAIFNEGYSRKKEEVFSRPAAATQPTTTGEVTQSATQKGSEVTETRRDNPSNTSEGKVTTSSETAKENGKNSGDLRFSTREAAEAGERAQQIVDEAEERIEAKRREEQQERANEVARGFGLDGVALPKNAENAEGAAVREAARQGTLRDAMGEDWDEFLKKVYQNTDEETLRDINEYARQNGWNFAEATERYLASLSDNGAFEQAVERGMWNNVREAFDDMLGSRGVEEGVSDNDARYALWRNERNKTERADGTILARATDIATDNSLGNDGDTRFSTDWDEDKNDPDVRYSGGVNEPVEVEDVRFGVREEEEKENKPQYGLSEEKDEKGHPFVLSSDGSTTFGEIGKETGLPSAPIKLSEGVITNPLTHAGYGFVHIEARHGDEIRAAGYKSIEEFVDDVARNYTRIVKGKKGAAGGDNSYLMQITDKNNNTLYIELSKDGGYWNVNSGGVFRNNYGDNREEVYSRHATAKQSTETVGETQNTEQGGTQANSRMNSPTPSEGKVTTSSETAKENGGNSGDLRFSTREAEEAGERAQQIVDEAEERIEAKRREEQQERANEVARGFGLDGVALPKNAENAEGVAVRELARPASGTKLARCGTKLRSLGRKEPLFAAAAWRLGDLCLPLRPDKRKTDTHRHEKKDDSGGSGGRHHAPGACAGGGAAHEQQPERCLPAQHGPGWTN